MRKPPAARPWLRSDALGRRGPRRRQGVVWSLVASLISTSILIAPALPVSAQETCAAETEPNDTQQDDISAASGAFCLSGSLPDGDQDLSVWEVTPDDVTSRWRLTFEGVPGTLSLAQLFEVTSAPGAAILAELTPIVELSIAPDEEGPATLADVLVPAGRYLVGITRSAVPEGGEPESIDYRLSVEPGLPWPANGEIEPNDDEPSATSVSDEFELGGDRQGNRSDFFAWELSEQGRWDLAVEAPVGENVRAELRSADGQSLDSVTATTTARLYDLELEAGTYLIQVRESGDEPAPYILSTARASGEGDPEPNDGRAQGVPVSDGEPIRGRLAKDGDVDRYTLTVAPGSPMLRDVRMRWRSGADRELCLLDETDARVACERGADGTALPNLLLPPGAHTFEVSGASDPEDPYLLRVDVTGAAAPDFEAEPNEAVDSATAIRPSLGMRARGGAKDVDTFRLGIEGAPQLWQIDVAGSGITQARLLRPNGVTLADADVAPDGSSAALADLYLVPGDHWLQVKASGPEYRIDATPLGPPDADGEREPNDATTMAEPYRIGSRRVGRLPTGSDRDLYRFTLAAAQHLRLDLAQPADAATAVRVSRDGDLLSEISRLPPGDPISTELWLEAGDHVIELVPEQTSTERYELTSTLLDPFAIAVDKEPNDDAAWARPVPGSLTWSGGATDGDDRDWYTLPPVSANEPLRISVEGDGVDVRLATADTGPEQGRPVGLMQGDDDAYVTTEPIPSDVPLLLSIGANGDYQVALAGAGYVPAAGPSDAALEVAWQLPVESVAAYWPEEQVIAAELEIENTASEMVDVGIELATSHYQWLASPDTTAVSIEPGKRVVIPVEIVVGADSWGVDPVMLSARATTPDGGQATASTDLASSATASPVGPRPGWDLPPELLGGLDVASLALGAEPAGTIDPENERRLFDGVTPEGPVAQANQVYRNGFSVFVHDHVERLPLELVVDLAGDEPIPIAGTIIDPQASEGELEETPREFELLLSTDGTTWDSVLRDTLSPLRIDQAFVLDEPTPATHAMLRIWSKYVDQGNYLSLGEWKVVAVPGDPAATEPMDVADPALGGHLVTTTPFIDDLELRRAILDADLTRETLDLGDTRRFEMIVGFKDGRAADVTELRWHDPERSDADERLERVDVLTSLQSAAGPWRLAGSWELSRAADGTVDPFSFEHPGWVRYLRLDGRMSSESTEIELPGQLQVLERQTDAEYRSIVGEWGYRRSVGPYEWITPVDPMAIDAREDAGDTRATATALAADMTYTDRVEIDVDEDWLEILVPEDHERLEILVDGRPTVGVALSLVDASGTEREMTFRSEPDGRIRYRADVEPGRYGLRVWQPPFSAVFAYDTSPSIDPFIDMVVQGLRSFLGDVRPGREAVTLLPFEEPPLVEGWEDDPYVLQSAFENHTVDGTGSSGAEKALIDASTLLAEREGARAILLVTDAETTTSEQTPRLWESLAAARPAIFGVHIGALIEPVASRERMQDWVAVGGGQYSYPTTNGEMDRAFERMATWLRRPAVYALEYRTIDVQPGTIAVRDAERTAGASAAPVLAPGTGVEVILDTSGSMRKRIGRKRRIQVAKASLRSLLEEGLAEELPVSIRTFGGPGKGKEANCGTSLALPLAPLDRARALDIVGSIAARKRTATPIAAALAAAAEDLAAVDGLKIIVLITDGEATCDGDVAEAIERLGEAGIDVRLDIVGFALEDETVRDQMAAWAASGGGAYYDASGAKGLTDAISRSLSAPFRVYGDDAEPLAAGSVGGEAVMLEPGTYRVEVLTDPPTIFDGVVLENGGAVTLELPEASA